MLTIFGLIGGLGLFLFGMRQMSDGLQMAAGTRLKRLLEVLTTNPISGVVMGTVVTALLQSSSTTTVMTVGFVNARLMTLRQAVGVIMGANIGTTVTAHLIAFRIDSLVPVALGIGAVLALFGKKERIRFFGQVVFGFGVLFVGLEMMSDAVRPLRDLPLFRELILRFIDAPLLGVAAGTFMTVVVQSSSAAIGLLQSMAREGVVSIDAALPILFGDNIGTTITAVLSAIGVSLAAKRAAAVHVVFNVTGTILFLIALPLLKPLVIASSGDIARQIANAHTFFNVGNTLVQLPFAGAIVWLVTRIVRGKEETVAANRLDPRFLDAPEVAINLVRRELGEMVKRARETVTLPLEELIQPTGDEPLQEAFAKEAEVNQYNRQIATYLAELTQSNLSDEQADAVRELLHVLADVERVGDYGENITELVEYSRVESLPFTPRAIEELQELSRLVLETYDLAVAAWIEDDPTKAQKVFDLEQQVDELEQTLRSNHIDRLNQGECHPSSGIVYLDIASNLERVADHAANIAAQVGTGRP